MKYKHHVQTILKFYEAETQQSPCEVCWQHKRAGDPWEPAGGSMKLRNENCDAINTRAKAVAADVDAAMQCLEPGHNVAFKYEGAGKYGVGRVVSKPRVLGERTRTDTEWLRAGAKVLDVEMYEDEEHNGKRTLTLAAEGAPSRRRAR